MLPYAFTAATSFFAKVSGGGATRVPARPPEVKPASPTGIAISPRWVLAGILLFGAFLRFYQLPTLPAGVQVDEAMNGSNILEIHETGRYQVFYPENLGREGLFINVQAVTASILGNEPWVLRSVSAAFGTLTVGFVYLLAEEMLGTAGALVAAFLMAASYWHLMLSRLGTRAVTAPFFLVLSLWLLLGAMRRLREGRPFGGWFALAGAVYGAGFHGYTAFRVSPAILVAVLGYFFVVCRREGLLGRFWKATGIYAAVALAAAMPLILYFIAHPAAAAGRAATVSVFRRSSNPALEIVANFWKSLLMFFWDGDRNWRHNYSGRPEFYWPVAILFAVGIGVAAARVLQAIRRQVEWSAAFKDGVLLLWLVVGSVPAVLSGEGVPHSLRADLMLPAAAMLAAIGAMWVWERLSASAPRNAMWGIAAVFALLVAYDPYHTYFDLWANSSEVPGNYSMRLVKLAENFNSAPRSAPRYLAVNATGISANGIPVLMMPFTYLTRSYTQKEQEETKIFYVTPQNLRVPAGMDIKGKTFCQVATALLPQGSATCVNLSY